MCDNIHYQYVTPTLSTHYPYIIHTLSTYYPYTTHTLPIHYPYTYPYAIYMYTLSIHTIHYPIHYPYTIHTLSTHYPYITHTLPTHYPHITHTQTTNPPTHLQHGGVGPLRALLETEADIHAARDHPDQNLPQSLLSCLLAGPQCSAVHHRLQVVQRGHAVRELYDVRAARLLAHVGGQGERDGGKELLHAGVRVCMCVCVWKGSVCVCVCVSMSVYVCV